VLSSGLLSSVVTWCCHPGAIWCCHPGYHLVLSSSVVILCFHVVIWVIVSCCHPVMSFKFYLGCHLGFVIWCCHLIFSSDVSFRFSSECHLVLLSGAVIWSCHLALSSWCFHLGCMCCCHLMFSSDDAIWCCHLGCHLGYHVILSSGLAGGDVICVVI
jgi:hypothetical protein